jgi:hypothetical protein
VTKAPAGSVPKPVHVRKLDCGIPPPVQAYCAECDLTSVFRFKLLMVHHGLADRSVSNPNSSIAPNTLRAAQSVRYALVSRFSRVTRYVGHY